MLAHTKATAFTISSAFSSVRSARWCYWQVKKIDRYRSRFSIFLNKIFPFKNYWMLLNISFPQNKITEHLANKMKIIRLIMGYLFVYCVRFDIVAYILMLTVASSLSRIFNDSQRFLLYNANGVEYLNTYLNIILPLVSHRISTGFASVSLLRL